MLLELKEEIEIELKEINRLFEIFTGLLEYIKSNDPDGIEIVALGGFLHSFYNGIENIFKRIAIHFCDDLSQGEFWHSKLLDGMVLKTSKRPSVISKSLRDQLDIYLQFRHVFRHSYSFNLQWGKMKQLVFECNELFNMLQKELITFLEKVNE